MKAGMRGGNGGFSFLFVNPNFEASLALGTGRVIFLAAFQPEFFLVYNMSESLQWRLVSIEGGLRGIRGKKKGKGERVSYFLTGPTWPFFSFMSCYPPLLRCLLYRAMIPL